MNIYKITNHINNKFYIGKSAGSIEDRFKNHVYRAKKNPNTYLHYAINKYGEANFSVSLVENVEENLNEREIYWIKTLSPQYNMTKGGDGGDTSSSPRFKKSMERYHSNRSRDEYATFGMLGKSHTDKTKKAQSAKRKKYWDNLSEEQLKQRGMKISGAKNGMFGKTPGNAIPVVVDGVSYPSKAAASRAKKKHI